MERDKNMLNTLQEMAHEYCQSQPPIDYQKVFARAAALRKNGKQPAMVHAQKNVRRTIFARLADAVTLPLLKTPIKWGVIYAGMAAVTIVALSIGGIILSDTLPQYTIHQATNSVISNLFSDSTLGDGFTMTAISTQ